MDTLSMIIKKHKYLVIDNNATCKIFTSLRSTANHILVDHTTLSKKLKNNLDCICKAKKTKNLFYIKRL